MHAINHGLVIDRGIPTALAPTPTFAKGTAYSQTETAAGAAQFQTLHMQLWVYPRRPSFFQCLVRSWQRSFCMYQLQGGHMHGRCQLHCPVLYSLWAAEGCWQLQSVTVNYHSSSICCGLHQCHTAQIHSITFACFLRWALQCTAQTSALFSKLRVGLSCSKKPVKLFGSKFQEMNTLWIQGCQDKLQK